VSEEVSIRPATEHVMLVEFSRPPHNYFDGALIGAIADAYEQLERGGSCRAIVLCSEGKHFCAGANFAAKNPADGDLYEQAVRLFAAGLPVVAAVQGAAVGGGLGVALSADFRVASPDSRFSANFARLGIHHGFGITVTLPLVVGPQRALELLYTGVRLRGEGAGQALSPREGEILNLLAAGLGNKEIAWQLKISEHTVKFHVTSIFNKLGASTRAEAVALGMRRGLIVL